jgi:hypothetical protein
MILLNLFRFPDRISVSRKQPYNCTAALFLVLQFVKVTFSAFQLFPFFRFFPCRSIAPAAASTRASPKALYAPVPLPPVSGSTIPGVFFT